MKKLIITTLFIFTTSIMAATKVQCTGTKAFQIGESNMQVDAVLNFELTKNGNQSSIKNFVGHVFIKSPYEGEDAISTENAYMGFFKSAELLANPTYRPNKYKGFAQFKDVNADHTTGVEDGMWGNFSIDVSSSAKQFYAAYVFQAGDHMGGTVMFTCESF